VRRRIALAVVAGIVVVAMLRADSTPSKPAPTSTVRPQIAMAAARIEAAAPVPRSELDEKIDRVLAADPVAEAIPMMYELSKEKQLETLYWLRYVPIERIVAVFPRLAQDVELTAGEKQQYARELVDGYITDLENAGVSAPCF
jgi:hypothetical protein